jgi:hypothetical protein
METQKFNTKYPESAKVDKNSEAIRIAEEFAEFLRFKKDFNVDTPDIYEWLGIDYKKYGQEVDRMYQEIKK